MGKQAQKQPSKPNPIERMGDKRRDFRKGESGNPGGLPKGYIKYKIRFMKQAIKALKLDDGDEVPEGDALVRAIHRKAIQEGDVPAARLAIETADGKPEPNTTVTVAQQTNVEQNQAQETIIVPTDDQLAQMMKLMVTAGVFKDTKEERE